LFTTLLGLIILGSIMALFLLQQPKNTNAVIVHLNVTNSDFDTDKPMAPQFNSVFQYYKMHMSTAQYRNYTEDFGWAMENATTSCSSPIAMLFPQTQKACNFYVPILYVICQADIVKQSVFECSNPALNDYIVSHGIRNPEANVRYAFEHQQRTTGNASDIFLRDKSIILK
jgi:hypothetical protein